ncbi:MAG: hypothetical protein VZR09_00785 [Candidatus Gastranaerophilaceae bacterium]|nr:hypothetical protein [Candidatus Gastranaerophilaceae bacterium]
MSESPFQKAYEFEEKYGIDRLKLCIQNAEKAYKSLAPETIDYCKCIIESVAKQIIADNNIEYDKEWTLAQLTKKSIDCLNCDNQHIRKALTNIIDTYSSVRNQQGIAAHGHIENGTIPTKIDVRIFASTFFHYMEIIFALLDKSEINANYTNLKFEKFDEIPKFNYVNQYVDNNVNVEYEKGTLFIDGAEFRPSEILYNLGRVTYDAIQKECLSILKNDYNYYLADQIVESFTSEPIENSHMVEASCFANIHEINFDENNLIIANGFISWEEYEPDSRIEDLVKVDCSAEFIATFNYEYSQYDEEFIYTLESFDLK